MTGFVHSFEGGNYADGTPLTSSNTVAPDTPGVRAASNGTTTLFRTSNAHLGTHCLQLNLTAAGAGYFAWTTLAGATNGRIGVRGYFIMATSGQIEQLLTIRNASGSTFSLQTASNGQFNYGNGGGGNLGAVAGKVYSPGVRYRVEVYITPGTTTTNGNIEVYVYLGDDVNPYWGTNNLSTNTGTSGITEVRWGRTATTNYLAQTVYWDDLYANDNMPAGTYIGPSAPSVTVPIGSEGTLSAVGAGPIDYPAAVALSGSGALVADAQAQPQFGLNLSGSGSLTAGSIPAPQIAADLSGSGALTTAGTLAPSGTAALSGAGALSAARSVAVGRAFTQLRFKVDAILDPNSTYLTQFSELAFYDAGGARIPGATASISAGVFYPNTAENEANLLDGDLSTKLCAQPTNLAVTLTWSSPVAPASYAWATANDTPARDPVSWTVSGSSDGTTWTTLDQQSNYATPSARQAWLDPIPLSTTVVIPLSGSGSLSALATSVAVGTASLSGSGVLSASVAPKPAGTASLSGSGSLSASTTPKPAGTATLSGAGSLSMLGTPAPAPAVALSGSGSLASSTTIAVSVAVPIAGSGTLAASGAPAGSGAVSLSGSGVLTGASSSGGVAAAPLSGSGLLAAVGTPKPAPTIPLSGSGALGASGGLGAGINITGSGALSVTGKPAFPGRTAALSGTGVLGTSTTPRPVKAVALSGSGSLSTTGLPTVGRSIAITGSGQLATSVAPAVVVAVDLSGAGALTAGASADLKSAVQLDGEGGLELVERAAVVVAVALSGSGQLDAVGVRSAIALAALSGSGVLYALGYPEFEAGPLGQITVRSIDTSGLGVRPNFSRVTVTPSISRSLRRVTLGR